MASGNLFPFKVKGVGLSITSGVLLGSWWFFVVRLFYVGLIDEGVFFIFFLSKDSNQE